MREQKPVSQLAGMKWQSTSFMTRMMVLSLLLLVGCMTLLPAGRANARAVQDTKRSAIMNAAVYDVTRGHYYTYYPKNWFVTGSSMKVPIMLTFLDMIEREGRAPTSHELWLLRTMIENSNNDSASALYYGEIGGAVGVANYLSRIGISGLDPNPNAWGWSVITPWAMVNLLTLLYKGTILTAHDRQLAFYLMEHVEADQQVGVGDTAPRGAVVAMKDGWVLGPDGLWEVNSSGIVMYGHEVYIIAVYTRDDSSLGAGQNLVRQISSMVASRLL